MTKQFTYHKISEKEKEEIRRNAKKLLNEFSKKIKTIKTKDKHFENSENLREEGEGWETDKNFKDITLENAPFVEDNAIIAEKGAWKK